MNKNPRNNIQKILDMYVKYNFPEELTNEIKQWIVSNRHEEENDKFFREIWFGIKTSYEIQDEKVFKNITRELGIKNKQDYVLRGPLFSISIAASFLIIASITGSLIYLNKSDVKENNILLTTNILTQNNETRHIELQDNIQVWINEETKISYTEPLEINLNGEAFFDLPTVQNRNFSVSGNTLKALVTGTKFNFRTYDVEHISTISLYEGSLQVFTPDTVWILKAGHELSYDQSSQLLTIGHIDRKAPEWMRDIINFKNIRLSDIFDSLEKIYGSKIDYSEFKAGNESIELKFEEGLPLTEVIDFISCITGTCSYKISDNIVYIYNKE